jgi:hypothetical protein
MDKNDKDIRKEIEELEKLIEQVKKQNEEEKKKHKKNLGPNKQMVVKINLAMEYSANFYVNLIVSFLVNFLVIFGLFRVFDFADIFNDIYIILSALILTFYEELHRKYLLKKYMALVVFSSGVIYFLMNLILFYFLDLAVFGNRFSFNSYLHPIVFVLLLHFVRLIIRSFYMQIIRRFNLKKIKNRR